MELTRRDLVALIFTSGTTGTPKGAAFDADRLAAGAAASGVMSAPYDRRLTSTPFSHAGYMFKLWDQLVWGSTLVVPADAVVGAGHVRRAARGASHRGRRGADPVGQAARGRWRESEALPHLRIGIVATAPAPPELVRNVAQRIGVPLVVRYAMTECPTIAGTEPADDPEIQFRTVGRPAAGTDVRIDPDGVVEVSGPCVMRGYWRNPELTAAVLRDGWLRTGDVGVLGDDGNLTLVGRSGDMYIRGGYNVHPGEVERSSAGTPA